MGHLITPGTSGLRDCLEAAHQLATQLHDGAGFVGYGVVELTDGDGHLKSLSPFANLITDAGDLYTAQKVIVGIAPAAPSAPTAMSGMKLGTGTTAVAKNGAGAALVTYLAGSNLAFDATFPSTTNLGGDHGSGDRERRRDERHEHRGEHRQPRDHHDDEQGRERHPRDHVELEVPRCLTRSGTPRETTSAARAVFPSLRLASWTAQD
jgi:hypothetical protein